eukprot:GEZU01016808.1.p1 GENE.GEZU01016808.1~~GEZU01016808.1.p1  ORF type:complete len:351 (-),score=67.49 GEZU01016808.1:169-1182(-)
MQAPNTNNKTQQHPKQKQQQQQNGGKKQNQNKPAAAKPMRTITPVWKERTAYTHKQHLEQLDTIINKFNQPAPSIVLLGDSMFERWKTTGQYVWCEKNFARFGSILNAGVGGDGTQHVLWRLQPENTGLFTKIQPRFVLLMIGTNNIERDSPEHIAEAIKIILETSVSRSITTISGHLKRLVLELHHRGCGRLHPRAGRRQDVCRRCSCKRSKRSRHVFKNIVIAIINGHHIIMHLFMPSSSISTFSSHVAVAVAVMVVVVVGPFVFLFIVYELHIVVLFLMLLLPLLFFFLREHLLLLLLAEELLMMIDLVMMMIVVVRVTRIRILPSRHPALFHY